MEVLMKRLISILLVLIMVCSLTLTVNAATNKLELLCPQCGSSGYCYDVWTEYNYYYTRIWYEFLCNDDHNIGCTNVWTTAQDVNNITRELTEEAK